MRSNLEFPFLMLLLCFFVRLFVCLFFRESKGETECDFSNKIIDPEKNSLSKNRESRMSRASEPQRDGD